MIHDPYIVPPLPPDWPFQPGDQPIDGLIMTKVLDQKTLNFTPEARLVYNAHSATYLFFDNDNII